MATSAPYHALKIGPLENECLDSSLDSTKLAFPHKPDISAAGRSKEFSFYCQFLGRFFAQELLIAQWPQRSLIVFSQEDQ